MQPCSVSVSASGNWESRQQPGSGQNVSPQGPCVVEGAGGRLLLTTGSRPGNTGRSPHTVSFKLHQALGAGRDQFPYFTSDPRFKGLPWWLSWERIHLQCGRPGFDPWVGKILWRREQLPTPVFWPREFHELYSPWGRKELDTTQQLSLSLYRFGTTQRDGGEGNGTPLQYSCLENPMDVGAW